MLPASLLLVSALAFGAEVLTSDALVKDAEKYDGKVVTVRGEVVDFEQKTSQKGNDYFVFRLKTQTKEKPLNVFGHGKLEPTLKDKMNVEITGKFLREKKVTTFTVKNEVDISAKRGEKPVVKVLDNKK